MGVYWERGWRVEGGWSEWRIWIVEVRSVPLGERMVTSMGVRELQGTSISICLDFGRVWTLVVAH